MRLIHRVALFALCLAAAALVQPSHAQSSSDPITLSTSVASATSNPGGTNEGSCSAFNNTAETIRVAMDAQVTYSDGTVARLENGEPIEVDPGQGTGMFILFVVPEDASLGIAIFECAARASGGGGHELEVGTAPFEVVAP